MPPPGWYADPIYGAVIGDLWYNRESIWHKACEGRKETVNIVEPYARIHYPDYLQALFVNHPKSYGIALLKEVEQFARVSHRSEDLITPDSWERMLKTVVMDRGDWSVTEHEKVTCEFYVDRGITHEIVRHRIGAYTQESTRFVNYVKKMLPNFIQPDLHDAGVEAESIWYAAIEACEYAYQKLVALGLAPQLARSVFPNALASKIIVTYNLRSWRHFFLMRTSKEAHPQMRQVTIPLLREFQATIPLLYDDIEPEQRQIDNMRKAR